MGHEKKKVRAIPKPAAYDGRVCFGINYYKTEQEASLAAEIVREQGRTYNGGFFDGMPCGREQVYDYKDPVLGKLYAVTI